MRKSVSFLLGASLMLATMPAFADSSSSASSSSSSSSSSMMSSSSSSSWSSSSMITVNYNKSPCADKMSDEKLSCLRAYANSKIMTQVAHVHAKTLDKIDACKDKAGLAKASCIRKAMMKDMKGTMKATTK